MNFYVFYVIASFTALILVVSIFIHNKRKKQKSPPGPFCLPFVGYLPFYGFDTIQEQCKKYGEIMKINILGEDYYVFSSSRVTKEAFLSQEGNVSGRAVDKFDVHKCIFGKNSIPNGEGDDWKINKRFIMKHLNINEREKTFYEACEYLLENVTKTNGNPYNFMPIFENYFANTISPLLFSKFFKIDDPTYSRISDLPHKYIDCMRDVDGILLGGLFYLSILFRPELYKRLNEVESRFDEFASSLVNERINDSTRYDDLLQLYITEMKSNTKFKLDRTYIAKNIGNMYVAGIDTTSNWLNCAISLMVSNQSVQKKVQEELDCVVGDERIVSLDVRKHLNYTNAVIAEIDRFACIVPFSVIRVNNKPFTIDGYTIPKRSFLLGNYWSISRDPKAFKNPENFDPENCLDESGMFVSKFNQFSVGKRSCIGSKIAQDTLFIAFTALMRRFDWQPLNGEEPKFRSSDGFVRCPQICEIRAIPRTQQ